MAAVLTDDEVSEIRNHLEEKVIKYPRLYQVEEDRSTGHREVHSIVIKYLRKTREYMYQCVNLVRKVRNINN